MREVHLDESSNFDSLKSNWTLLEGRDEDVFKHLQLGSKSNSDSEFQRERERERERDDLKLDSEDL